MSADWVKGLVPLLGTALAGPLGGAAAGFIADKLGIGDKTVEAVTDMLSNQKLSADQIASLKQAELDFKKFLEEKDIRLEELTVQDRVSARERDAEYVKAGQKNVRADILAYGALIAFCVSGWALFTQTIPQANRELIVYLLGALTVIVKDLYGFEFGSSKGSQDKTREFAQALRQQSGEGGREGEKG